MKTHILVIEISSLFGNKTMKLIESTSLADMCDYNFGDQASMIHGLAGGFMKDANIDNKEFVEKYVSFKNSGKNIMTLFIDNIRLYNREIKSVKDSDRPYVNSLLAKNDLLYLCSIFNDMNFIIFTGHEDTPIDDYIFDKIPPNVLSIFAVNAESFSDKVIPIPYGLQRKLHQSDNRLSIIKDFIDKDSQPTNLLYINHSVRNNESERKGINELFFNKEWAFVQVSPVDYVSFLNKIKEHKFMVCPIGNAIDCHRNWEVLYLKRVPIMKKNKYFEKLFEGFPVLFVNDFSEINKELLEKNEHLYQDALNLDLSKLDLDKLFNRYINQSLAFS